MEKCFKLFVVVAVVLLMSSKVWAEDGYEASRDDYQVEDVQENDSNQERVDNKVSGEINKGLNGAKNGIDRAGNAISKAIDNTYNKLNSNVTKN